MLSWTSFATVQALIDLLGALIESKMLAAEDTNWKTVHTYHFRAKLAKDVMKECVLPYLDFTALYVGLAGETCAVLAGLLLCTFL